MDNLIKIALACLLFTNITFAKEIEGVNIPEVSAELQLNGVGIRNKFFFDLYIGALYLEQKTNDAHKIINDDAKMALKLHIISSMITSEKMEDATREGFEKSLGDNVEIFQSSIDEFISVFKEEIKIGDVYDLIYTPNIGLDIYKNAQYKKTIKGLEFKKALFGIWIGDNPAQDSLKTSMLGL